ncbi:MAG: spore maturation protein A [Erysipelotrichales bacterium]|nr:spore maturation protein A [Erysipelotrichales bacterium]
MNVVWLILIGISILGAWLGGRVEDVNVLISQIGKDTLEITLPMIAMACFFNGWLAIAERLEIVSSLARILQPFLKYVFPELHGEDVAKGYIASNLLMNALGLGSAATTSGLKAMKELHRLNHNSTVASNSMITFLLLNSAGITLFSTTVAALRIEYGSTAPFNHIPYAFVASVITLVFVILIDKWIQRMRSSK